MNYTPKDMLKYVLDKDLEAAFLGSLATNTGNYSIGEITDVKWTRDGGSCILKSDSYNLDMPITDDQIVTAVCNQLYVSAFISRHESKYDLHFLVHQYPISMKPQFEDEITHAVIQYMIMKTIIALRLDSPEKIDKYCRL